MYAAFVKEFKNPTPAGQFPATGVDLRDVESSTWPITIWSWGILCEGDSHGGKVGIATKADDGCVVFTQTPVEVSGLLWRRIVGELWNTNRRVRSRNSWPVLECILRQDSVRPSRS